VIAAPGLVARGVLLRPLGDVVGWLPMVTSTTHEIGRTEAVPGMSIDQLCTGVARG
jgi:adenosylmethionine-8-amino-7-oxononanoate aminotransferase